MNISIGILAHNEAENIPKTLSSLFQQSLLAHPHPDFNIEINVIANGCTDQTEAIAIQTLENLVQPNIHTHVRWHTCSLERSGKANAWNHFVHKNPNPKDDYLCLIDADIILIDPKTLESMINLLETQENVTIAVDKPMKDIAFQANKNLLEKLSLAVSSLSGNKATEGKPSWICGQLYCGRAKFLRRIWLPINVQMDDSFIYEMSVTDSFKSPKDANRVVQAPSASHIFEAYTDIKSLFLHQKWLVEGETVNRLIYDDLRTYFTSEQDVGLIIKERNEQNPNWIYQVIQAAILTRRNGWLIPSNILTRRFVSLFHKPFIKAVLFFPLTFIVFLIDLFISILVNLDLNLKYRSFKPDL